MNAQQGTTPEAAPVDTRPYPPGLEGVIAAETGLALVDGENGRLLYRGYRIGDLVDIASRVEQAQQFGTIFGHDGRAVSMAGPGLSCPLRVRHIAFNQAA